MDAPEENEWLTDTDQVSISSDHDSSVSDKSSHPYGPAPPPNFNNDETQSEDNNSEIKRRTDQLTAYL